MLFITPPHESDKNKLLTKFLGVRGEYESTALVEQNDVSWADRLICLCLFPSFHMAHDMLHVISAGCVARDLHTIAPWPLGCTCWRQLAKQ